MPRIGSYNFLSIVFLKWTINSWMSWLEQCRDDQQKLGKTSAKKGTSPITSTQVIAKHETALFGGSMTSTPIWCTAKRPTNVHQLIWCPMHVKKKLRPQESVDSGNSPTVFNLKPHNFKVIFPWPTWNSPRYFFASNDPCWIRRHTDLGRSPPTCSLETPQKWWEELGT